ncbi:efflux transporter outer membrane subunit [Methylovorus sp. SPW-M1]
MMQFSDLDVPMNAVGAGAARLAGVSNLLAISKRWRLLGGMMGIVAASLSACSSTPLQPLPGTSVPDRWQYATGSVAADAVSQQWWQSFGSDELDQLLTRAQRDSFDVQAAAARVEQAVAQARIAGAPLLPELNLGVNASRQDYLDSHRNADGSSHTVALAASYEVDFWGRNRALRDRARYQLQSSHHDLDTVQLTLTSGVARLYLQVLGLAERLSIAELNVANASRVLEVVEARYRAGAATALEVAQQRGLLASQQRTLETLRQQLADGKTALAVLIGLPPAELVISGQGLQGVQTPQITPGLPAQLLVRRPDIARAEAALAAADANTIAARAAMLPRVQLTGSLGLGGEQWSDMLAHPIYSVAAALTAPVFNAGRLAAGRDLALAQRTELLQNYRAAIVAAFGDVETALNAVQAIEQQRRWQSEELAQAERAFRLAETRYRAGADTLLTMLDAQRTWYSAQDQAVQLTLANLQGRVALFKALGGGWQLTPASAS